MAGHIMKTYRGNCHCAKFVYELKLPEIKEYVRCTCSICRKKGYAWVATGHDHLNFVKGSFDGLTVYTFNDGNFEHMFCPDCGTPLLASNSTLPKERQIMINIRALQDINIWSLDAKSFDEPKTWPPQYQAPVYDGPEPSADVENAKIYHGSCHCGAVKVALKSKPLETLDPSKDEDEVIDCNCSICVRNAYLWFYPATRDHTVVQGEEHLIWRSFNTGIQRKAFCKHCGVHILNEQTPLTEEEIEALSDYARARRNRKPYFRNINLRILNDFDCTTLNARQSDGWNRMSPGSYRNP